jgi:hypothetical protein
MKISRRSMLAMVAVVVSAPVVLFALAVAMPAAQAPLPDLADTRLITNVRIIDVDRGRISEPTDVLIERGRIEKIATGLAAGRDVPVLDAKGRYLSPGFWDMHTHSFQGSPQLHFPLFVANGITGMRDMMDCPRLQDSLIACVDDKRRWTALAAAGRMTAPRVVEVASFYFDDPQMTPAQASQRAATYHHRGVDTLKVYNRLPHDTYLSLAADARKLQMQLVGHLPKSIRLDEALQQGQRSFEHGHLLARHCFKDAAQWRSGALDAIAPVVLAERMVNDHDPAACLHAFDAMRAAGVWWVPTHVTREEDARAGDPTFLADPRLKHLDPLSRWAYADDLAATVARYPHARGEAALGRYFEHGLALTGAAHRAGVHILVGTDTAIGGFRFHDEMALLVRAGMSPAAVLRAATLDAAQYAGMQQQHGSVTVGKMADLVLLDANPLDDISNTRRIHAVLLGGRLHDRQGLNALLRFNADQAKSPTVWAKLLWGFARSPVSAEL